MSKSKRGNALSGGCLSLFGLPFLIGGLVLTFLYFNGYRKWLATQRWVETPCWIETVELKTIRNDGTTYQTKATYRYEYQGATYRSDVVSLYSGSDNVGTFHQDIHDELVEYAESLPNERLNGNPIRKVPPFRCYVNPVEPDQAVIYRALRWPLQAFMSIFALTFTPIGAGLVVGGFVGARMLKAEEQFKTDFPLQPWKWKKEWVGDAIPDHSQRWQPVVDIYTLWSAAIITPLIIATASTGAFQREWQPWLLWITVGLWLIPASVTWRGLRKRWSIGHASLHLEKPFIEPGSHFSGMIRFEREVSMPERACVQLLCEKKTTVQTSDGSSTSTEVVWQSEKQLSPSNDFVRDFPLAQIPFSFEVPLRAHESGKADEIEYRWNVAFEVTGTLVKGTFEVPVFHTDASRALAAASLDEEIALPSVAPEQLPELLAKNGIQLTFDGERELSTIVCKRARNKTMLLGMIAFNLVWSGVAWFLLQSDAPMIFKIVWPVSAGGLWLMVFWQAVHRRLVTFDQDELTIHQDLGVWNWTHVIRRSQIMNVTYESTMRSGRTHYYAIRAHRDDKKKFTLVDGITESGVAHSLSDQISQWLTPSRGIED